MPTKASVATLSPTTIKTTILYSLVCVLLLSACGPNQTQQSDTSDITTSDETRSAQIEDIENDIQARTSEEATFSSAKAGQILPVGGQARSGEDSRARLELMPDASIVRIGPNSLFVVEELSSEPQNPFTRLYLEMGQIWTIISGGELLTETPVGTAGVRGSFMGVSYDPDEQLMTVTCLDGECRLYNDLGQTDLASGQAADITGQDQPPSAARYISADEYNGWMENNPEAQELHIIEMPLPSLQYILTNNCSKNYYWKFIGPDDALELVVPPGDTLSGELTPGQYSILVSWMEGSSSSAQSKEIAPNTVKIEEIVCTTP